MKNKIKCILAEIDYWALTSGVLLAHIICKLKEHKFFEIETLMEFLCLCAVVFMAFYVLNITTPGNRRKFVYKKDN